MARELALLGGTPAVTEPDLVEAWPPLTAEDIEQVLSTLRRGELSYYGREGWVARLEDQFSRYHQTPYALAVDSGTSALHSAFFGLGLGPGDEVLVPTYTFITTVTPLLQTGAIPRLCDADPLTGNLAVSDAAAKVSARTRAIVVTHMWGHPCDMDAVVELARQHNLRIVEDCSHAHGARYKGRLVGTFGDAACFSVQARKIISGGTGGVMLTSDRECYERAVLLGHFRTRSKEEIESDIYAGYAITGLGLNYRMHPLAAALASSQFTRLDNLIAARGERHAYFSAKLEGVPGIRAPFSANDVTRGAFYGYKPFFVPEEVHSVAKATYVAALRAEGVQVNLPGSVPLHRTAMFRTLTRSLFQYGTARAQPDEEPWLAAANRDSAFPGCDVYARRTLDHTTFTNEPYRLIDQYVEAFRKVAARATDLLAFERQTLGASRASRDSLVV